MLLDPGAELIGRADALALARSVELRAGREGSAALYALAARVLERLWRIEGREQDAKRALELFASASRDVGAEGACDAALEGARLAGDAAHDAARSHDELYRVQRRFAPGGDAAAGTECRRAVADALALLVAFRPSKRALDAMESAVEGYAGTLSDQARSLSGQATSGAASQPAPAESKPPLVTRIESWPGRDASRVVVELSRPAGYRVHDEASGGAKPRTSLDFDGVDLGAVSRDWPMTGIVSRVRAEATSTGSNVSLDLDGRAWRRVFHMNEPYRVIIDVARNPPGVQGPGGRTVSRIMLDPGHGGKDMGASGSSGIEEKDVTLDVAQRAAPVLSAYGVEVAFTRNDDRFVSLEERTARANAFGADLFVSIHCNASEMRSRRGIETYVLDTTRDEIAARVAARENATTPGASAELTSILGGMRIADEAQRSTRLARLLQRAAVAALQMNFGDAIDGGVHPAGFYVLVGARMPSVLFETSYLSNTADEQRLRSAGFRQLLADSIVNAIKAYREGR